MASNDMQMVVSVESIIHETFSKVAMAIYEQHGVQVNGVDIEWLDVSTVGSHKAVVTKVSLRTEKPFIVSVPQ